MTDGEEHPDWRAQAQLAGWKPGGTSGDGPAQQPAAVPDWMREAQAAGWSPLAPTPAPPAQPNGGERRAGMPTWLVAALAAVAALLILGGGLTAILLISGGGDAPKVDRSPLTLTTATHATVTTITRPDTPSRSQVPSSSGKARLVRYDAGSFTAMRPAGWAPEADAEAHSGYFESIWRSRNDPNTSVKIDWTPDTTGSAHSNAQGVRAQANVSREIAFRDTNLAGQSATMWLFDRDRDRRVDYFVNACGTGYAILGSTSIGDYAKYKSLFRRVARSVAQQNAGRCE